MIHPQAKLETIPARAARSSPSILAGLALFISSGAALAKPPSSDTPGVPTANGRATGKAPANRLTLRLLGETVASLELVRGSAATENSMPTVGGFAIQQYGFVNDGPNVPALGSNVEGTKTEPDKNTYIVLRHQHGADAAYDYGTHFLYQGHEGGISSGAYRRGCLTRINLDADSQHRVTVLATQDNLSNYLPVYDGSVWDPFAGVLLLTAENGDVGGVWQATPDYPSVVTDVSGIFGRGSYEGIQIDSNGAIWIVEDIGGVAGTVNNKAKQPNSYIYRFTPTIPWNLALGGKLQALQVASRATGSPIEFHAGQADADILSQDMLDLHTYGLTFNTQWVTLHDTATDGFAPFDANAAAKAQHATAFKRPENGQFRPDGKFRDFYFTETGDTNSLSQAGSAYGGYGSLMHLSQQSPASNTGALTMLYIGNIEHTGLDNLTFLTKDLLLACEDAGDTLHGQRNALDSMFLFDVRTNYGSAAAPSPVRVLAEGRDSAATADAGLAGTSGYQNEGDNEITGIHVSDGDPSIQGLLGKQSPNPFNGRWRIFWTQQHGDNVTSEIISLDNNGHGD